MACSLRGLHIDRRVQEHGPRQQIGAVAVSRAPRDRIADVEHAQVCWRMLRGAAEIALQECDKSDPRARSPSKKKRRGRASSWPTIGSWSLPTPFWWPGEPGLCARTARSCGGPQHESAA
jgi:hypothetical protein